MNGDRISSKPTLNEIRLMVQCLSREKLIDLREELKIRRGVAELLEKAYNRDLYQKAFNTISTELSVRI